MSGRDTDRSSRVSSARTPVDSKQSSARSFGSPKPIVPQLRIRDQAREANRKSISIPIGGSSVPRWGEKTTDKPTVLKVFRKKLGSENRNTSTVFAGPTTTQPQNRKSGQALHSDPFANNRAEIQPRIVKRIQHPTKPDDNRVHHKVVPAPDRKDPANTMVMAHGAVHSLGKKTNTHKYDCAHLVSGSNMDRSPVVHKNPQNNRRFSFSPTAAGAPSEFSPALHTGSQNGSASRLHTTKRTTPQKDSLVGVFIGEPLKKRDHQHRPPWHTNTPRAVYSGGNAASSTPWSPTAQH